MSAVILAGGRSSRLDGAPKAGLIQVSRSLLEIAIDAVDFASERVVVGELPGGVSVPAGVFVTREFPPFAGPAAAIAAGIDALGSAHPNPWVVLIACDMPKIAEALVVLRSWAAELEARSDPDAKKWDGALGIEMQGADVQGTDLQGTTDQPRGKDLQLQEKYVQPPKKEAQPWGKDLQPQEKYLQPREQYLVSIVRLSALREAVARLAPDLAGVSVRRLFAGLTLDRIALPAGSSADVDTWADVERLGIDDPRRAGTAAATATRFHQDNRGETP